MKKTTFKAPVSKNEYVTLTAVDMTHQGMGVCKVDQYPIFVEGLLVGETAKIKIIKIGKSFAYGRLMNLIETSPERVEVMDKAYAQSGIMPLQHLSYQGQLAFKKQQVENVLERIAKMPEVPVFDTIGMDQAYEYRNKAQIPVRSIKGQLETGFYRRNSHDLIPMEDFQIQDPKIDEAIIVVRDLLRKFKINPYDEENNRGTIRHIIVRRGYYTKELMIVLVTRTNSLPNKNELVDEIVEALPETVSVIQNINSKRTNVILGRNSTVLFGEDNYTDELLGYTFNISHQSFYQVNPTQTESLYDKVLEYAELTGEETVIDAYSGIGTITLALSKQAKQVYGVEIVASAVENAKKNAQVNNVENVSFEVGAAEDVMVEWAKEGRKADVLVVDPPRKGLDERFIDAALEMQPERIVYVSCNPSTLARDLKLFAEGGYTVEKAQPVDLFPQTIHIETVVSLKRTEN